MGSIEIQMHRDSILEIYFVLHFFIEIQIFKHSLYLGREIRFKAYSWYRDTLGVDVPRYDFQIIVVFQTKYPYYFCVLRSWRVVCRVH